MSVDEEQSAEELVERIDPEPPAKPRDPWFDNAKYVLVTTVVVGHAWTLLPRPFLIDWLYDFVYYWHIPAFVIITGYLSRSFEWTRSRVWNLVRTVLIPYLVFEGLMSAFRIYVGGEDIRRIWINPHWPMWYLSAMFFWRMLTPALKRMRWSIFAAVVISIITGARGVDVFDLSRVLGLMPFFVIGLRMRPEHFEALRTTKARTIGLTALAGLFALAAANDYFFSTEWLYYRSRYDMLTTSEPQAMLIRACLLAIGAIGAFAVFTLIPARPTFFTKLGASSLVVYLCHGFVLKALEFTGLPLFLEHHPWLGLILITPLAVWLAYLLSARKVARRLSYVVDPVGAIKIARLRLRTD